MDNRVFESGASASVPLAPASPSTGYPTAGDPLAATPATVPGPYWFYQLGEELRALLVAAGITPDHEDLTQIAAAVQALATNGASVAEMVAATITDKAVTPGRQKYSPMSIKKVIKIPGASSDGAVTPIITLGGAARAERQGAGYYRVLFSTTGSGDDMASGTYTVLGFVMDNTTAGTVGSFGAAITPAISNIAIASVIQQDATGFIVKCEGSAGAIARDPLHMTFIVIGTLP